MEKPKTQPREEDVFDYQIGLDEVALPLVEKHFFDIAGYLPLGALLTSEQVKQAREELESNAVTVPGRYGLECANIIECGGVLEDAMALPPVIDRIKQFIWGRQHRLGASRALRRDPGESTRLSQGGVADERRYARYRCLGDGQFRCLLTTCLIALQDSGADDGGFCVVPSSHKAQFSHPYESTALDDISPLSTVALRAGEAILFTESLSHAFRASAATQWWLVYQYGTSYMVTWPGCEPSAELLGRTTDDPVKSHLLLEPYYHPMGSQKGAARDGEPRGEA